MICNLLPSTSSRVRLTMINPNLVLKYDIRHICKIFSAIGFHFYNSFHLCALADQKQSSYFTRQTREAACSN